MIELTDTHSLTDFSRNPGKHLDRLKQTGRPELLTIDGQAEIVVQSAAAYQQVVDAAAIFEHLPALRISVDQAMAGAGRPMRDVVQHQAAQAGITPAE